MKTVARAWLKRFGTVASAARNGMKRLKDFVRDWPVIEVVVLAVIVLGYYFAWKDVTLGEQTDVDQRSLGATAVSSAITGTLTVVGILLSAALIGLQMMSSLSAQAKTHVRYAVWWAGLSLLAGAIALALIPSRVGRFDVAADPYIAIWGMVGLTLMVFAAARIVFSIRAILQPTP